MEKVKTSEWAIEMLKYYIDLEEQPEEFGKAEPEEMKLTPVTFMKMPLYRQAHNFTCGIACVQSALRYAGYDFDAREDRLLKKLSSTPERGTTPDSIVTYLKSVTGEDGKKIFDDLSWKSFENGQIEYKYKAFSELWNTINNKKPVICIIQAWADRITYSEEENNDGHYVIAVGTALDSDNKDYIIFMDPSTAGGYAYIGKEEFLTRWHDADGDVVMRYYGLILNYNNESKSEESTFYKLG